MKYMLNKHTIHNTENNGLISIKNQNLIKNFAVSILYSNE